MLVLSGSPRVLDSGMTTTARSMRLNRLTGEALAEGDVKSTYSQLKPDPAGALLASSDPIHVTSRNMTAKRSPGVAVYTGNARLWQDANIIEAPSIQFDRDGRSVVAQGNGQPVSTVLVSVDKSGKATPVAITCARLTYTDSQRQIRCEGGATAKGSDMTITASVANAFLLPRDQSQSGASPVVSSSQLDRIVGHGNVVIQQPGRRAAGQDLVYTVAEDKFVLTGGPPSIFDAEHGEITGDSLTFYKRDGRVLVEGRSSSPTVTTTRVAR
jgi:lipopolysaccharide export system protein LptA